MPARSKSAEVAVLESDVRHVRELVERNHRDSQQAYAVLAKKLEEMAEGQAELKAELSERRGAEKLATAIRTTFAGVIGAGAVKLLSWLGSAPIK